MDQPRSHYTLFSAYLPGVSQTAKFGGTALKTALTLDTVLTFGALPKPPPGLMMRWKDPQSSVKAVALTVTVYYGERIQAEISQRERHTGQSLGQLSVILSSLPMESGCITPPPACIDV